MITATGAGKAAVLLVSLGPEVAGEVMRHLDEGDRLKVVQALSRVRTVDPEQVEKVGKELAESLDAAKGLRIDGRHFARTVVEHALGDEGRKGGELLAALEREADGDGDLGRVLESIAGAGLSTLLAREHPQVAAVILAHLDAGRAAEALVGLTDEQQADLLDRVARLDRIPSELQSELGLVLKGEIQDAVRPEGAAVGGPRTVAEILNCVDKPVEERLLGRFDESDGDLGQTIRTLMFTFEDCIKLEQRSLQTLLKEVSREDLLLALKTATPALLEKILANVSSRAAEILREDLAAMGAVRVSDVEAAQARIIAVLRELEADGKVVIASKGKGDVLV
ncbi:MAG TPA: flagellar motor switch protein FliG [Candidatus Binatia bacterium]|nr:flagellar motor switch protein FliG [Candidatus Binatia bacterium]